MKLIIYVENVGGRKIVRGHSIIDRVCPACHGRGRKDWITYAMGEKNPYEPPDHQFLHNLVMRNIQILVSEIHMQALELGITADVSVEFKHRSGHGPHLTDNYPITSESFPKIRGL